MAREIIKQEYNTYEDISTLLESTDQSWNNIKIQDRFIFCKFPYKSYYINPATPDIEIIKGPYKVFDLLGNTLIVNKTNACFRGTEELFKYGPLIAYLKTEYQLYLLFISRNSVTTEYEKGEILVSTKQSSSISISNTTQQTIYYSYSTEPIEPPSLFEIKPGEIEIIQPTSVEYLYIKTVNGPVAITSNNTRTKVVNTYFLLVCPSNYTKVQVTKLTGNPISTIVDELDIFITI